MAANLKDEKDVNGKLQAPQPSSVGKPEVSDGTSWFTLATENWVLNTLANIPACLVATTANLTANYVNGASGVGATLTNSGTLAALSIDGVALAVGQRVLVKDQTTALQNGIYTVTNIGSGSVAWILTRATDFDSVSQMIRGNVVEVISGTTNGVTAWMLTSVITTVGTDSITFARLSKSGIDSVLGTTNQIVVNISNNVATVSIASNPVLPGNASVTIPTGSTAQRPGSPTAGMLRFNTSL
jgi:hypothetical protein